MPFQDDLYAHLAASDTAPFLFVGSGLSRRYLGADDWESLLRRFAEKTNRPYERFRSDANGDAPATATAIAAQFKDVWWDDKDYAGSRDAFPSPRTSESPLKYEISRYLDGELSSIPTTGLEFEELELLRSANAIEGVITTNYDGLLETIFPEFAVYAGQEQLLFNPSYDVGEIFKIHGSTNDPETLVLTTSDYDQFNTRNPYLAAKLLTIFVEHPVVFLGYSLSDPNIKQILQNIGSVLTDDNLDRLRDRLIFIQWSSTPVNSAVTRTMHLVEGMPIPIISIEVNDFMDTFAALARLHTRLPAPVLRRVKEQIYELVTTSKAKGTLQVRDIDDEVDPAQVEIVIGVGIKRRLAIEGLVGWGRMDLIMEVLTGALQGEREAMERVSRDVLPNALAGGTNTPVFYYLRGAERLDDDGALVDSDGLHARVMARANAATAPFREPKTMPKTYWALATVYSTFTELAAAEDLDTVLLVLQVMDASKIDPDELRAYLADHVETIEPGKPTTNWAKAVCVYDALAYGPFK